MDDRQINVLLVEDNPGDARLIQEEFNEARYGRFKIEWVDRLGKGLEALTNARFDVILLDLSLPDSTGLDTLVKVQEHSPDLPIVVLTGLDDESKAVTAMKEGAQDYLVKGNVDGDALSRSIRYAIERKEVIREIESLRREVAMSEKLSALGALVSGMAQQIRTSTTYITNTLFQIRQRVEQAAREDPELQELVEDVGDHSVSAMEGISNIDRLVRDLRRFTKSGPEERETIGLQEAVQEAVDLFRVSHQGTINLVADLQATEPIEVNRGQVQQVVLNLLNNATEAMPDGGTVRVTTRPAEGGAELVVEDEGEGLTGYVENRMFEPFFTTRDNAGLGLPITQRIVDAHDGEVSYESEQGQGTTFTVFFPGGPGDPQEEADAEA